jgi:hypothetical protein
MFLKIETQISTCLRFVLYKNLQIIFNKKLLSRALFQIKTFQRENEGSLKSAQREVQQAVESAEANIQWMNENYEIISEWLIKENRQEKLKKISLNQR